MVASLHLARYSGRDAVAILPTLRRLQRELDRAPGLAAGHVFATVDLTTATGGLPTPRRWALFCGWEDDSALDELLRASAEAQRFLGSARETWAARLQPVRLVSGGWRGWEPKTNGVAPLAADEPVAVITYGVLRPRYMPTFFWNNRKAVRHAARSDGLLARLGLMDRIRTASTFTLWRSSAEMVRFAYGPGEHKPVVSPSKSTPWAEDYFFARFRVLESTGSWDGRAPLAAIAAGRADPREPLAAR
jgi:hypothetical protein